MVTVGPVASYKTLLSVEVEALFALPVVSVTTPAPRLGTRVPCPVTAVADRVQVMLSAVDKLQVMPVRAADALFALPVVSVTTPAPMLGTRVPCPVTAVADRVQVMLSAVESDQVMPVAEPDWVMSPTAKVAGLIASEKTIVKSIGSAFVGSD